MTDIYLFVKGPEVKGDSEDAEHTDAIEILSFSDSSSMPITDGRSFAGSGTSGIAHFSGLSFTKIVDSSSVPLMKHCWTGTHFDEMLIKCYRAGTGGQRICYLEILMKGCVISSIQFGASSAGLPTESITIDYATISYTYKDTEKMKGTGKNQKVISYNRTNNEVS